MPWSSKKGCMVPLSNNMVASDASIQSFSFGALPPNCLILFSGIICKAAHHLPYYAAKVLMPFLLFYSLEKTSKCHPALQLLRIVALTWFVMAGSSTTTTTTKPPQSISIRQPPTCLNVVDPSDHPPNNLFSYQPSLFISIILPRRDQHRPPTRVSSP